MYKESTIYYFDRAGVVNTELTIQFALKKALNSGINTIVVPTETGRSALMLKEMADQMGYNGELVAVRYHTGFNDLNEQFMGEATYEKLLNLGIKVHTGTHLFSSISRSFRLKWEGLYMPEIVGETLKILGNGFKTAIEVAVMAANGGLIKDITRDIVSIGGTVSGLDTAIVLRAAYQNNFLQFIRIREIICRPRDY
ncbi:MAG: hypothetical protein N3C60_06660 [Calditerrivibrio sp.]|nr:hypothetical protein [Calditerrivibrio sp.]